MSAPQGRSQEEILARIEAVTARDFFGFAREVLIEALDFEHAKPLLKDGVTAEDWPAVDTATVAADYLKFAIGKILNHRGISASRSVDKLREYAWLLGRDDVVAAMDAASYAQYGAPQVKAFALTMGWPFDGGTDQAMLDRMAEGLWCHVDCEDGCGR